MISRYNYRPYRSSYRLQAEARTEKQIRTFSRLIKKMRKEYDTLEDMAAEMYPNEKKDSYDKDVWYELRRLQNALSMLDYHVPG